MKRLALVLAMSLVIAAMSGVAAAAPFPPIPAGTNLTPGVADGFYDDGSGVVIDPNVSPDSTIMEWDSVAGAWRAVRNDTDVIEAVASAWNTGPLFHSPECNIATRSTTFTQHASIAQWMEWSLSSTRKDWRVQKPGILVSDCIDLWVRSNNDVEFTFNLAPLKHITNDGQDESTTQYIVSGYGIAPPTPLPGKDDAFWHVATSDADGNPLNAMFTYFVDDYKYYDTAGAPRGLHYDGHRVKLWSWIDVQPSHTSSEYEGTGTITATMMNVKAWIDGVTGGLK